jgi:hypothetical protein
MSPDELCNSFAQTGAKLTVKDLNELVLIEGDPSALMFLGQLLIAQAQFKQDCGFEIGPNGPGNVLFSEGSTRGFYIHVIHSVVNDRE